MIQKFVELMMMMMATRTMVPVMAQSMTPDEIRNRLNKLTKYELSELGEKCATYEGGWYSPVDYRSNKDGMIRSLARWCGGERDRIDFIIKATEPDPAKTDPRVMPPSTRYITKKEFQNLPSYTVIERAVTYPYNYNKVCDPFTRDGYVSVAAIYNMSAWASWKSSSLDPREMAISRAIQGLHLLELKDLNQGRKSNQPAVFPIGGTLLGG